MQSLDPLLPSIICQYLRTADITVLDSQSPANCAVQKSDLQFLTVS